jgi:hypothetical protein
MASVRHLGLFPFCTSSFPPDSGVHIFDVGDFTQYPFTLPALRACELWWRVKEWELSFTYSRYIDLHIYASEPPGSYSEILPTSVVLNTKDSAFRTQKANVNNEQDLICFKDNEAATQYYEWTWTAVNSFYIASDPPSSGDAVVAFQANFGTNWDTQQLGFHPPFVVQEDPNKTELWTALYVLIAEFSTLQNTTLIADGLFDLGQTSRTFKMGGFDGPGLTTTLSNVKVRPIEYYPYDPRDGGGPIYDKLTGKQLRPFPS